MRLDDIDAKLDRIVELSSVGRPPAAGVSPGLESERMRRTKKSHQAEQAENDRGRNDAGYGIVQRLDCPGSETKTFNRLMTTKAAIGQTPKELIWTLNKAKLYRYIPVVPAEERHPVPLLLVFALMNRPTILDLRPGHSFVEYMVGKGYDVYLLDWGVPGPEDKNLKFDDYTLDYMPRAIRKMKAVSGVKRIQHAGLVHRRDTDNDIRSIATG